MSDTVITVDSLSKCYQIGVADQRHRTFSETLTDALLSPVRRLRTLSHTPSLSPSRSHAFSPSQDDIFWALKDVSFEVKRGEVVGIIGRNGAGKSTLLKILSRITEPTKGEVRLRGRVASLLEVGTGFHPELTGRENIYLNGAILGMKRAEIARKFDEIVAFAEVGKFLDTPVKRYSSGMYVRLAFAVAAHLEPEILIVDEVLAVGDAEFQKKCLGKMKEVSQGGGRTVLFVSHNMGAIRALCGHGIWLDGGRVLKHTAAHECVDEYLRQTAHQSNCIRRALVRPPDTYAWMTMASLGIGRSESECIRMGDDLTVTIDFESTRPLLSPSLGLVLSNGEGLRLINTNNRYQCLPNLKSGLKRGRITCSLGRLPLMPGRYSIAIYFGSERQDTHIVPECIQFDVQPHDLWGHGQLPPARSSELWWPAQFVIG